MQKHAREFKFQKFFLKNYESALPGCYLIKSEKTLYSALDLLNLEVNSRMQFGETAGGAKIAGRIDLLIKYRNNFYAVEIKYSPFTNSDFWNALKVIGYTAYLNWQDNPIKNIKPAIMIPKESIKLEHKIVRTKLGLTLFGITKKGDKYFVELIN